jgi:hypothetical protein
MTRGTRARLYALCLAVGCGGVLIGFVVSQGLTQVYQNLRPESALRLHYAEGTTSTRVFTSDAAIVLNLVDSAKTDAFERQMLAVQRALRERSAVRPGIQPPTWRMFKSDEAVGNGLVLYVFWSNPVVRDTEDTLSTSLSKVLSPEVLVPQNVGAQGCSERKLINLRLVSALTQ